MLRWRFCRPSRGVDADSKKSLCYVPKDCAGPFTVDESVDGSCSSAVCGYQGPDEPIRVGLT